MIILNHISFTVDQIEKKNAFIILDYKKLLILWKKSF